MLSIDFETLARKYPDLRDAWRGLEAWVKAHPTTSYLDMRQIAKEVQMEHFDPVRLAIALEQLKKQTGLKQVYKVLNPGNNQFLRGEWTELEKIPESVPDAFDNHIDLSNLRVVAILKQEKGK